MKNTVRWTRWPVWVVVTILIVFLWINNSGPDVDQLMSSVDQDGLHAAVSDLIAERILEVEKTSGSAESWGKLAVVLDLHDLNAPAIQCYQHAIDGDSGEFRWPYFAGICSAIGNREQALDFFAMAHRIDENYAPLLVHVGLLLLQGGDVELAQSSFQQSVAIDGSLIQGHLGVARCALALGDPAAADVALQRCESLNPQSGEVDKVRAVWWSHRGEADKAKQSLARSQDLPLKEPLPDRWRNEIVLSDGVGPQWWIERSRRLMLARRVEEAIEMWQGILVDDPDHAEWNYQLAYVAVSANQAQLAITHFLKATKADPEMFKAFAGFGAFLLNMGNEPAAEKSLRDALALDPDSIEVQSNLGVLLMSTGRSEEGLTFLQKVRDAQPDDMSIRLNFALALKKAQQNDRANQEFSTMLQDQPIHARARFEWGVLLAEMKQLDAAAEQFLKVVEDDPMRSSVWINLTRAYLENGRYEKALSALRSARKALPRNASIAAELAWLLASVPDQQLRNGSEAEQIAAKLCEGVGAKNPRSFDIWAASLAELQDFDGAVEKARQAQQLLGNVDGGSVQFQELEARIQLYLSEQPYRLKQ
ncbi:MAG: tetratricopeptide repeat protein [Planctomycetota bacterium]